MSFEQMNSDKLIDFFDDMEEDKEYFLNVRKSKIKKKLDNEKDNYGYFIEKLGEDTVHPIAEVCELANDISITKKDGSKLEFHSVECAYKPTMLEKFLVVKHYEQLKKCISVINIEDIDSITSSQPICY